MTEKLGRSPKGQGQGQSLPLRNLIADLFAREGSLTTEEMANRLNRPLDVVSPEVSAMVDARVMHVVPPQPGTHEEGVRYALGPLLLAPPAWGEDDDRAVLEVLTEHGALALAQISECLGHSRFTDAQIHYRLSLLARRGKVERPGHGQWAIAVAVATPREAAVTIAAEEPRPVRVEVEQPIDEQAAAFDVVQPIDEQAAGSEMEQAIEEPAAGETTTAPALTPGFAAALSQELSVLDEARERLLTGLRRCDEEEARLHAQLAEVAHRQTAVQAVLAAYSAPPPGQPGTGSHAV